MGFQKTFLLCSDRFTHYHTRFLLTKGQNFAISLFAGMHIVCTLVWYVEHKKKP